jgi:microcystin-dependent protein
MSVTAIGNTGENVPRFYCTTLFNDNYIIALEGIYPSRN